MILILFSRANGTPVVMSDLDPVVTLSITAPPVAAISPNQPTAYITTK